MKTFRAFKDVKLGQTDEEKRKFVEDNKFKFVILRSKHEGENYQQIGSIKPGDKEVYYFKPFYQQGNNEMKRLFYHDLISIGLDIGYAKEQF